MCRVFIDGKALDLGAEVLGQGAFAIVRRATHKNGRKSEPVAVKIQKSHTKEQELVREALILCRLSRSGRRSHVNLVPFYGFSWLENRFAVVTAVVRNQAFCVTTVFPEFCRVITHKSS
jgi:serine/threonine protein kinase